MHKSTLEVLSRAIPLFFYKQAYKKQIHLLNLGAQALDPVII